MHYRGWDRYFNISISNPLKTWWQARKYFKFPKVKWYFYSNKYSYPFASKHWQGKILDIDIHDVYWKDKWNSPRHERNPLIYICLFGKYTMCIRFTAEYINEFGEMKDHGMEYWEYLLDYLYYSKSLALKSCWQYDSKVFTTVIKYGEAEDGSDDERKPLKIAIPTHLFSLNKEGLKNFKELYDKRGNTKPS